jgi:hypothetical protein
MPRSSKNISLRDAQVEHLLRVAVVAATLFDPIAMRALLDLPDEELGRRFKIRLTQVIGLSTALNLDFRAIREEGEKLRTRSRRSSSRPTSARHALVADGRLLRAADVCATLGITEERLRKNVASGRIFTVEVDAIPYYPAFFLARELDRKDLARVVRRLNDFPGWSKWDFLTAPNGSLGNLTPLQAMMNGEVKQVLRAAGALAKR